MKTITTIFDIGKTNKKCFLFDEAFQVVHSEYIQIPEIEDEEGFPCDDILAIETWIKDTWQKLKADPRWNITALNFSGHGASLVHVGQDAKPISPFINYLKPYPQDLLDQFYHTYGAPLIIARETASPPLAMLNSGLQLYWLKHRKPQLFDRLLWSMHLPQYLSFLFTGAATSDFPSIGCHTSLWDYEKNRYHRWVKKEGLESKLPSIKKGHFIKQGDIAIGQGIHDSSAALLPYFYSDAETFVLVSTGTWSISMNPFFEGNLTKEDLQNDCLSFLRLDGNAVKASRVFLGNEYALQVKKLAHQFDTSASVHKTVKWNEEIYQKLTVNYRHDFHFESIGLPRDQPHENQIQGFQSFEEAYIQLILELVELQAEAIRRVLSPGKIDTIYVDGGFVDSEIFIQALARKFPQHPMYTAQAPLGSALGAALLMQKETIAENFLEKHYKLKRVFLT